MAKRTKKLKKKLKSKKKVAVQMHDKNCKLCLNYSCLTEKVVSEVLEKRLQKEAVKDPEYKISTNAIKLNVVETTATSRRASLRPRKEVLQETEEVVEAGEDEKRIVVSEVLEKRLQKEAVKDPEYKISTNAIKLNVVETTANSRRASLRPRKEVLQETEEVVEAGEEERKGIEIKEEAPSTIIEIPCPLSNSDAKQSSSSISDYDATGLHYFLQRKPKGVKPKLEFIKPKIPLILNYNKKCYSIKSEPSSFFSSQLFHAPSPSTPEEASPSPINKYSYLLKDVKHEVVT
uniref:Uncharacterized protein n=1 Tax=Panagrolaimus sp. ES5 TaxID=591445 RepID=A0AC34G572_9BILA